MTHPSQRDLPVPVPPLGALFGGAPAQITVAGTSVPGQPAFVKLIIESINGTFGFTLDADTALQVGDMLRSAGAKTKLAGTLGGGLVVPSPSVQLGTGRAGAPRRLPHT